MANNAVELSGVTKTFGAHTVVQGLDLTIPARSIYGFIGPNGSGKTTTIRMILRIFYPDCGRIEVLGRTYGDCADDRVGYLPEERGLYRRMKVRDLLRYYARLKGMKNSDSEITAWLQRLGGEDWGDRKIDTLSKGMAQKVQFISAVITSPELLILDEPFTGLDPVSLELLRNAILEVRSRGTTIILSTHDMDVAERLCDTVFMIHNGAKVLDGTLDSIQKQYSADEVRVRLAHEQCLPVELPGVVGCERRGPFFVLKLKSIDCVDSLLQTILTTSRIEHFELVRPSLHDIFLRIAGAAADETPSSDSETPTASRDI